MATKFVVRSTALTAYKHSGSGKTPLNYIPGGASAPALVSDAGAIGGQAINYDGGGTLVRGHLFPGFDNCAKTGAIAVLHRFAPRYSGTPSVNQAIIDIAGPRFLSGSNSMILQVAHLATSGNLVASLTNAAGQTIITANTVISSAWSPTSGTYYDLVVTWDGTTSSNALKFYLNGTLLLQTTASRVWAADANQYVQSDILLGAGHNSIQFGDYYTNEFIIWDSTIDPTSGGLNLNGASRSAFVAITGVLDPTNSTDPGIHEVATGVSYIINGVSLVGDSDEPSPADVRLGTVYDNSSKVGTLAVPAASNVKLGVAVDAGTGTLESTDPGESNVADGVDYVIESVAKTGTRGVVTNILSEQILVGQSTEAILVGDSDA